jgi:monoamine oxidase
MRDLNRRDFLGGALAAGSGAYIAGCSGIVTTPLTSSATSASTYDVIVVGSGMAGLAAASTLHSDGLNVLVLEGRNRIGGRTYTDTSAFDVPVDLGAQWFHQTPSNPLVPYARAHRYKLIHQSDPVFYDGTQEVSDPKKLAPLYGMILAQYTAIDAAGSAASRGLSPDKSAWQATKALRDPVKLPWYDTGEATFGPDENGILYQTLSSEDQWHWDEEQEGNTLIKGGMGAFVSSFAQGLTIKLSTPVTAIRRSGSGPVQAVTAQGVFQARAVIVTTPMGGLQAGLVAFDPPLPRAYLDAIANLRMGTFEKIFVGFSSKVFGDMPSNSWIYPYEDRLDLPILQAPLWGGNVGLCIVGADLAFELRKAGTGAMIKYALEQLAQHFDGGIKSFRKFYRNGLASNWLYDRWTRGSYSNALPGHVAARKQLAVPVDETLFFAGEALSINHFGSMCGAYESALVAADQVRRIGRVRGHNANTISASAAPISVASILATTAVASESPTIESRNMTKPVTAIA